MADVKVKFRGAKGKLITLKEATDLLVVRTKSGRSLKEVGFSTRENQSLSDREVVFAVPHAGVEVVEVGSAKSRNAFRKSLPSERDVKFAGRAFRLGNSQVPVIYTENLFVKMDGRLAESECVRRIESHGLIVKRPLPFAKNAFFLGAADGTGRGVFDIPDQLFKDKSIDLCHPELVMPREFKSAYPQQWHLKRTNVSGVNVDAHANVVSAWQLSVGRDTTIAIIDDGTDENHEEFSSPGKIVAPRDVTLDKDGAAPGTGNNHGTACAGVACADGRFGASGVAPSAKLMPIRLYSALGSIDEAEAFYYAAQKGADIISCSWGPPDGKWWDPNDPTHNEEFPLPDSTRLAIDYAIEHGRDGRGCVITWAGGNGNESADNDGYARYNKVVAVGACNDRGKKSVYSDFGKSIWCSFPSNDFEFDDLNVPAPLTPGIWTTDRSGLPGYNPGSTTQGDDAGNYTNSFGGTSSACPGVAGVAALILSVNPALRWDEVKEILKDCCDRIDDAGGNYDTNGHSQLYGYGRINAARAVAKAIDLGGEPQPAPVEERAVDLADLALRAPAAPNLPVDLTQQALDLFRDQLAFLREALAAGHRQQAPAAAAAQAGGAPAARAVPGVTPEQTYEEVATLISQDFNRSRASFGPLTKLVGSFPAIANGPNRITTMQMFTVNVVSPIFGISPALVYNPASGFQDVVGLAAKVHEKRTVG